MEAEEVERGFTPANETEKMSTPSSKAEARRETTFVSNSEDEQLDDLYDLEAEQMEVGFRVVRKQTIKFVLQLLSHLKVLVIMCWVRCYKCLAH
jgi:hypothetical protein